MKTKRMVYFSLCLTAAISALSSSAFAGREGHGGNAVSCATGLPGSNVVVLDYYNATLPTIGSPKPTLVDISKYSSDQVVSFFKNRFSSANSRFEVLFENALKTIGPINSWISVDLKDMNDANETYYLPSNSNMLQAAARQGTTMFGDPKVISLLSPAQQGVLLVHEALYYVGELYAGLTTSENVRALVREALQVDYSMDNLKSAISKIDGSTDPWKRAVKSAYYSDISYGAYMSVISADPVGVTLEVAMLDPNHANQLLNPKVVICSYGDDPSVCSYSLSSDVTAQDGTPTTFHVTVTISADSTTLTAVAQYVWPCQGNQSCNSALKPAGTYVIRN